MGEVSGPKISQEIQSLKSESSTHVVLPFFQAYFDYYNPQSLGISEELEMILYSVLIIPRLPAPESIRALSYICVN